MADQGQAAELLWSSEAKLELLGPVRLGNSAGDDLTPKVRKTRALLALLALSKGPVSRSRLIDLLWGDRGEEQAKASLRQALYELRSLASSGYLTADRQSVGLGPKKLPTDVSIIQQLIDDCDAEGLAEALEGIDCAILASLDDVTPELDEWLREERARIITGLVGAATGVAEEALKAGNATAARRLADRIERLDALDERAARLGIRADLAAADRPAAMRRYSRILDRLADQLGIAPAAETEALLEETKVAPARIPRLPASSTTSPAAGRPPRGWLPALIALALIATAATLFTLFRSASVEATPTVAVLPFEEVGQKQNYFAAGVSDEILNLLAHQTRLRVLGRITAEQVGERPNSLEVARKLGITHLLDGSVRSSGNRVLVIVRLTRVSDGAQLWSERYERRIGDIFAVQGEIASAVASRLTRSLAAAAQQATSPEVYDRYLAARELARERREVTLGEADRLLREAIRLDPRYAPAYAELAEVIMLRSNHPTSYGSIPYAAARAEAEPLARKAIALDPNLGDGYAALGFLSLNLDGSSEPFLRKAVELSPQRPEFHRWHAETLDSLHRYDDAIAEYKRAVEIDPLWGLNYEHLIGALYLVGRKAEARDYVKQFLGLSSDQRARLLVLRQLQSLDSQLGAELKTVSAVERAYPDERTTRLNLASTLGELGERRQAVALVAYDPVGTSVLTADWPGLARAAEGLGPAFWNQSGFWNTSSLLFASGHSDALVRFYDRDRRLIESGGIDMDRVALPELIVALRNVGRNDDAEKLLADFRRRKDALPNAGYLGDEKTMGVAVIAALAGDRDRAIRVLDDFSRRNPFQLAHIPAMSLRYDPVFSRLAADPRFSAIDERLRAATNAERAKAGLPPISREAWISNPKTLLTKN
jgi:DNA-binding SARP family transcriptional activator/TolB-like protein